MSVLQDIFAFIMSVVTTGTGTWKYKIPTETKTEKVVFLGFNLTITESYADGEVKIEVVRS